MPDLDQISAFAALDSSGLYALLESTPARLEAAWDLAQALPMPHLPRPAHILLAGVGAAGEAASLLAAAAAPASPLPVLAIHDSSLPAFAAGPHSLVMLFCHSGEMEETLALFDAAAARGCSIWVVAGGGELTRRAAAAGTPIWSFSAGPCAALDLCVFFTLGLAALAHLQVIPDAAAALGEAVTTLRAAQAFWNREAPVERNPAKRLTGQLFGRAVNVVAAGQLVPVAQRWKNQFNLLSKTWAQADALPGAGHNSISGLLNPPGALPHFISLFLRAPSDDPRNRQRSDFLRRVYMTEGLNTDTVDARGEGSLAHMWSLLLMGDYAAYYLAMMAEMDPAPLDDLAVQAAI